MVEIEVRDTRMSPWRTYYLKFSNIYSAYGFIRRLTVSGTYYDMRVVIQGE